MSTSDLRCCISLALVVGLFTLYIKEKSFFGIRKIIVQHVKALGENHKCLYLQHFLVPAIPALALSCFWKLTDSILTYICTFASIWIAILLALLPICMSLVKEKYGNTYFNVTKKIFTATMFEFVVCISTTILCLLYMIVLPNGYQKLSNLQFMTTKILSFLIFYFLFLMLIGMFLVLKNCNAAIGEYIAQNRNQSKKNHDEQK